MAASLPAQAPEAAPAKGHGQGSLVAAFIGAPPGRSAGRAGVIGAPRRGHRRASASNLAPQSLLEALDLARGVDDRLLAGEERVAVAADVHTQLVARGAHGPLGSARSTVDLGLVVLGMDVGLHGALLRAVRTGQRPPVVTGLCS